MWTGTNKLVQDAGAAALAGAAMYCMCSGKHVSLPTVHATPAAVTAPAQPAMTAVTTAVSVLALQAEPMPPGTCLEVRGQIVCRRKLAKDLIFFDIRHPPATGVPSGESQPEQSATVEVVVSGRAGAGAETLELARSLRQGDIIHILASVEAGNCPKAAVEAAAAAMPQVLKVRGNDGLRIVSKWAELNGQTSFASTLAIASPASQRGQSAARDVPSTGVGSQRSRSKRGRKAAQRAHNSVVVAPGKSLADASNDAEGKKRHPGVKTRRRK